MSINIRPMVASDHEAVLEVARSLSLWFRPLDQMTLAIDLRDHRGIVAERQGTVLGFLLFHIISPSRAELSWLGVTREVQSQGVGGLLLAAVEETLRSEGIHRLQLNTIPADYDPNFTPTNDFYLKHGFKPVSRDEDFYAHQRPGIRLEKRLAPPAENGTPESVPG